MQNNGASFGINFWGLNIVALFFLLIVFSMWRADKNKGWILILIGGGLNLIERIFFGFVNDYLPIFGTNIYNNINDYLIFIGGIMVIWDKWKKSK